MGSAESTRELIPPEIDRHRVAWLITEDEHGTSLPTRVRFASDGDKIYTWLPERSPAMQRIRAHPRVCVSFGRGNGRIKGPDIPGVASEVIATEKSWVRHLLARKYWWRRITISFQHAESLIEIVLE